MVLFGNTPTRNTHAPLKVVTEPVIHIQESLMQFDQDYMGICREMFAVSHIAEKEGCYELLQESMSDVINNIVQWIKRFKDFIVELFKKLFMFIESIFMDTGKFIDKYKNDLDLKKPFEYSMYEYDTDLMKRAPNLDPFDKAINSFNQFDQLDKMTTGDIREKIRDFLDDSNLNALRGEIAGLGNQTFSEEAFLEGIRDAFRKGKSTPDTVEINNSKATTIMNEYRSHKDLLTKAKSEKVKILAMMDRVKTYFEKGGKRYQNGTDSYYMARSVSTNSEYRVSQGENERLNLGSGSKEQQQMKIHNYFLYHFTMVKHIGAITSTVLTEKVNALKEMVKVHGTVAKKAIMESKSPSKPKEGDK